MNNLVRADNTLPLLRRDIETSYEPKLVNLPHNHNLYLIGLIVGGGIAVMSGQVLIAAGIALVAWEGMSQVRLEHGKLSEHESYALEVLDDKHPKTGETLNRVVRDMIGKMGGDRALPSMVMAELLQKATLNPANDCYVIESEGKLLHTTTWAEQRFCQLFAEHTGRGLTTVRPTPALGLSPEPARELPPVVGTDTDTRLNALETSAWEPAPAPPAAIAPSNHQSDLAAIDWTAAPKEPERFDWNALNTQYNDFPHLILLGKTGAGKTFLAERLGRFLDGDTLVITPKKSPRDFQGMKVIGLPYDFVAIARAISKVAALVKDREAEMNQTGREDFEPLNVILDEVPAFVAGCKDDGFDVVKDLKFIIRTARTSKIRLILIAQGSEVKTLGIEGEGSLRDNLTFIRLRGFAEPHARALGVSVAGYDRPCMVGDEVADLAELVAQTSVAGNFNATAKQEDIAADVAHLESLLNLVESEEVVKDEFELFIEKLTHECQSDLRKFIQWLSKKRGEQITLEQVKSNWAKNANFPRKVEAILPLIQIAKSQKLLTVISDSKWQVIP